jgi:hypothetical protein
MRQKQTKTLIQFLSATAVIAGLVAGINFIFDPFQVFRPALFYPARYSSNPRIGDVGLIKSQTFDTVFMGTSYSFHIRQSEIDESLGGKSIKLGMSGGTSKEQNLVIASALKRHPKRVIWQMDDYMFRDSADVDAYLPADLYRMNVKGVLKYLFSRATFQETVWISLCQVLPVNRFSRGLFAQGFLTLDQTDANEINAFPPDVDPSSVFNDTSAKQAFEFALNSPAELTSGIDYNAMVRNFDRDAIGLINDNPDISFVIYFPPSSILSYLAMQEVAPRVLATIFKFNEYELGQLAQLSNVSLHDFRDVGQITHNLTNYRDTIHYSPAINRQILASIASGEHGVDNSNPMVSIENLKRQVKTYKVGGAFAHSP